MSRRLLSPDTDADREVRRVLADPVIPGFTMIAGAGSGKTTSLVKALDSVITSRGNDFLANRQQVACVTYTEIAKQEIEADLALNPIAHVSTIHSFLWTLVEPFQKDIWTWVHAYGNDTLAKYETVLRGFGRGTTEKTREAQIRKINRLRDGLAGLDRVTRFRYGVARNYREGVVGHDEVLKMVPELIQTKPLLARLVARRYPFVFVDESQDTFQNVVDCLQHVAVTQRQHFCLGFFGDPMQKIYTHPGGNIALEDDWREVKKPENFRSPLRILDVINTIRADDDGLTQISGLGSADQRPGEVTFFVFPVDERRSELLRKACAWLEAHSSTGAWKSKDGIDPTKILVITHQMAARRLGFENLYDAFHGTRLSDDFDEGRAWPLTPFIGTLLPLAAAARNDRHALLPLLRKSSPLLQPDVLDELPTREVLKTIATGVDRLQAALTEGGTATIREVLMLGRDHSLVQLDDRLAPFVIADQPPEDADELAQAIHAYLNCSVAELRGYSRYVNQESPYSTQQGVKGAEYPDVLVVIDDDESTHFQFSYDKLLGLQPPSATDVAHLAAGRDNIINRTRRLLYVCTSRATRALAIVLYAADIQAAINALQKLPGNTDIITAEAIDT